MKDACHLLALLLMTVAGVGCARTIRAYGRLYKGPERPGTEVAILRWVSPVEVRSVDGILIAGEDKGLNASPVSELELPPGAHLLSVGYYDYQQDIYLPWYIPGMFGDLKVSSKAAGDLRLQTQAGHIYEVTAREFVGNEESGYAEVGEFLYLASGRAPDAWKPQLTHRLDAPVASLAQPGLPGGPLDGAAGLVVTKEFLRTRATHMFSNEEITMEYRLRVGSHCYHGIKHGFETLFRNLVLMSSLPTYETPTGADIVFEPSFVRFQASGRQMGPSGRVQAIVEYRLNAYDSNGLCLASLPVIGSASMKGWVTARDFLGLMYRAIGDAACNMVSIGYSCASRVLATGDAGVLKGRLIWMDSTGVVNPEVKVVDKIEIVRRPHLLAPKGVENIELAPDAHVWDCEVDGNGHFRAALAPGSYYVFFRVPRDVKAIPPLCEYRDRWLYCHTESFEGMPIYDIRNGTLQQTDVLAFPVGYVHGYQPVPDRYEVREGTTTVIPDIELTQLAEQEPDE